MKFSLLYVIPLVIYLLLNVYTETFSLITYIIILSAFFAFRLSRLRYPRNVYPWTARAAHVSFYALTVALMLRDRLFSEALVNGLLAVTLLFVILDLAMPAKKAQKD